MANRRIVGRCRAAYTGKEGDEYRKQLEAEKLYKLMDSLGYSEELQRKIIGEHIGVEAKT